MKDEILKKAIERLKDTKQDIIDRINKYEEDIRNYIESNKELEDNLTIEVYNEKTEKLMQNLKACETVKDTVNYYLDKFKNQRDIIQKVKKFNLNLGGLNEFYDLISSVEGIRANEMYLEFQKFSKPTRIPFPFKYSDLTEINNIIGFALIKVDNNILNSFQYISGSNDLEKAKDVQKSLSNPKLSSFYDKMIKFFNDVLKEIDHISRESGEEIQKIRDSEIKRRKDEIKSNIDEINRKIDECKKSLVSIGDIYRLYDEYNNTKDQEVLIKLTEELANLVVISQRESRIITYDPTDKEEKLIVDDKPLPEPEETNNTQSLIKGLTSPLYYKETDTQNIICFLGKDEDDNIFDDINNHFDYSNRNTLLGELVWLFNYLYSHKDYTGKSGGNPKYFSSSKVKAYINRLGFNYLRLGVSEARYRIHVITRDSELLKNLGYGSGRLTFFGALGVNDDNEKTGAYDRIARRGILSTGNTVKLQPNFDYIEHISRSYVPISFLSDSDKEIFRTGAFNGKVKGTKINKTIENEKYVFYDILDDESKSNVKNFLDDYFDKQSEKMFKVINEFNKKTKRKKNQID